MEEAGESRSGYKSGMGLTLVVVEVIAVAHSTAGQLVVLCLCITWPCGCVATQAVPDGTWKPWYTPTRAVHYE
jgi:hypothetical protein